MVIFICTSEGFKEIESLIVTGLYSVWIGAEVLTDDEISAFRDKGIDFTDFQCRINPSDKAAVEEALDSIATHHPGERVWMECVP